MNASEMRLKYSPADVERIKSLLVERKYLREQMANMHTYGPPFLIVIGTIANMATLMILIKMVQWKSPTVYYFKNFLVVSTILLLFGIGLEWLFNIIGLKLIENRSHYACRLWTFISSIMFYSPLWIVVGATFDRYIATWHHGLVSSVCTNFTAKCIVIGIFIGLVVLSVHVLWTYDLTIHGCNVLQKAGDYSATVWPWLSVSIYTILPLVMIVSFCAAILIGICRRAQCSSNRNEMKCETIATTVLALMFFVINTLMTVIQVTMIKMPQEWVRSNISERIGLANVVIQLLTAAIHASLLPILLTTSAEFRHFSFTCLTHINKCGRCRDFSTRSIKDKTEQTNSTNVPLNSVAIEEFEGLNDEDNSKY